MEQLRFWGREALDNVRRNRVMSLLAISTVTVALFILGAFFLTLSNLRAVVGAQTQKLDIVVVLQKGISPARRLEIYNAARISQVKKLDIVMASQALEKMGRELQMPVDDWRRDNPLGDELHVQLRDPNDYFAVGHYLASIQGVESIKDSNAQEAAGKLLEINRLLSLGALVALAVLGLAILLIIHNAIRLTLFARRREIRIMQLVGATNAFIRVPFLLEGLFYGLVGAGVAALGLVLVYGVFARASIPLVAALMPLSPGTIAPACVALLLGAGALFGALGAWISFGSGSKGLSI